jgi:phage/plasmid-like protein (TIGR03299 family)
MSHELTINAEGKADMFYRGEAPWHKLGTEVKNAPTIAEAIKLAGLDWKVEVQPTYLKDGSRALGSNTVRMDNGYKLGRVGDEYKPLQNSEALNFFQPFIDSGAATLETAGSLKGGKRIFILAQTTLAEQVIVAKSADVVRMYVLVSNGHDGTLAIRVGFTPIRVVCENTLEMAHHDGSSKLIRIRHTGDPQAALLAVQETMNLAKAEFEATAEQYRNLARHEISPKDLETFVRVTFDLKAAEDAKRTSTVLEKVTNLFEHGRGNDLPGVKGTFWAAYNAAAEYVQYERGKTDDSRLDSTWFGTGAGLNRTAFLNAVEMMKQVA